MAFGYSYGQQPTAITPARTVIQSGQVRGMCVSEGSEVAQVLLLVISAEKKRV
jgi:hypothetical protein